MARRSLLRRRILPCRPARKMVLQDGLRLTDDLPKWSSQQHPHRCVSLRGEGHYRVWFRYQVPDTERGVWTGTITSEPVDFSVASLPPGERRTEPTTEQLAAIQQFEADRRRLDKRVSCKTSCSARKMRASDPSCGSLARNAKRKLEFMDMLSPRVLGIRLGRTTAAWHRWTLLEEAGAAHD